MNNEYSEGGTTPVINRPSRRNAVKHWQPVSLSSIHLYINSEKKSKLHATFDGIKIVGFFIVI